MPKYCEYSKYEQYRIPKYFKYRQYFRVSNPKILPSTAVFQSIKYKQYPEYSTPKYFQVQAVSRVVLSPKRLNYKQYLD